MCLLLLFGEFLVGELDTKLHRMFTSLLTVDLVGVPRPPFPLKQFNPAVRFEIFTATPLHTEELSPNLYKQALQGTHACLILSQ